MNRQRFVEVFVEKMAADGPGLVSRVGSGVSGVAHKVLKYLPAGALAYLGLKGLSRGATEALRTPETEEEKRQNVLRRLRQI